MVSLIESAAAFKQRCGDIGLPARVTDALVVNGITTLATLSYAHGQPGEAIDDTNFTAWLETVVGSPPTMEEVAKLKRLLFESQTMVIAALRQAVEDPDSSTSKRVPPVERRTRLDEVTKELTGVEMKDELEPAYCLLDAVVKMRESQALVYLPPSKCTSRTAEIQQQKPVKEITIDQGSLTVQDKQVLIEAPTGTEMQVFHALQRRGLALHYAHLQSYLSHQRWVNHLFMLLSRDAPAGFQKVTLVQVLRCDRSAWVEAARCAHDLKSGICGVKPLDAIFNNLISNPSVMYHVMPLPRASSTAGEDRKRSGDHAASSYSAGHQNKWSRPEHGPSKGKSKGKGKSRVPAMPEELRGMYYRTSTGDPICFGYNTKKGCASNTTPGERCARGLHVCAKPRCQQAHAAFEHV